MRYGGHLSGAAAWRYGRLLTVGWNRGGLPAAAVLAVSFTAGSIPFTNIASVQLTGTDLRRLGTGTVSGTALYQVAGFPALAAVGLLEVGKGTLGPLLAGPRRPLLAAVAGAAAIAGHDFSPFLRGAGGRGLSPALGATLVLAPEGAAVLLAGLGAGHRVRRTSLGCFLAYLAIGPLLGRTRGKAGTALAAAIVGPLLFKRVVGNELPPRPRLVRYLHRLVFDEDEP